MPIQGFAGFGGGATSAAFRSSSSKTYVDDVFSTYLWDGTGSSRAIDNGLDLSGDGGMAWIKKRSGGVAQNHVIVDTERTHSNGTPYYLYGNTDEGQDAGAALFSGWNSDGFDVGGSDITNGSLSSPRYGSWSFKKSAGFFDVITYTGNGSNRTISHNLECIPGCIMVKRTDASADWCVWHRRLGMQGRNTGEYGIFLNTNDDKDDDSGYWNNTNPTASVFSVGTSSLTNHNGGTYVAYIFGHGDSSGYCMEGANGNIKINDDSDLDLGTSNSVYECWFKCTTLDGLSGNGYNCIFDTRGGTGTNTTGYAVFLDSNGILGVYHNGWHCKTGSTITCSINTWYHVAVIKSSTTVTLWVNGVQSGDSGTVASNLSNDSIMLGCGASTADRLAGKISNFRVSDTAIYNASYNWVLPEFPLCSDKNTKLLCANKPNVLQGTVVPSSGISQVHVLIDATSEFVTDVGSVTAGNVFGADEDENIIKCGGYQGNGSSTDGPIINCGWEPAYIWIKNISSSGSYWRMVDMMRGMINGGNDRALYPDLSMLEEENGLVSPNSTGFQITTNQAYTNENGSDFIYMAIRRPDGYVGKPDTAATDVFTTVTMAATSAPGFVSGFPVDFALYRQPAASHSWGTLARLMGVGSENTRVYTNTSAGQVGAGAYKFDFMNGWLDSTGWDSSYQSWMWKRHKGMDVVCYEGNGTSGNAIPHSMNAAPEMMIIKARNASYGWLVYHSGLNGGSGNTYEYGINLTDSAEWQESSTDEAWGGVDPTSTHFTVGELSTNNNNGTDYIAFLFSSVTGISKVGVYAGSDSAQSITTGFQPRFVMIKNTANTDPWYVLDTTRGWASGDDKRIYLNENTAQSDQDVGAPTSTGFDLTANVRSFNQSGRYYIYYAHA